MTQIVKDQNNSPQRPTRPGQRQQERLRRIERRRKRTQIIISSIAAIILIIVAIFGLVQYQNYTTNQANAQATATTVAGNKADAKATAGANATATAGVQASATAVANQIATVTGGSPIPTSGPATPPAVTGATVTMSNGLKYIDVRQGSGAAAQSGSKVTVEYTGWLQSNGKKFDSSYDHGGQPFSVTLGQGQVIPGWDQGLVGVKAGGTRRLIIPPALGYGASGQPPTIPANATLIFDVTVLSVQ